MECLFSVTPLPCLITPHHDLERGAHLRHHPPVLVRHLPPRAARRVVPALAVPVQLVGRRAGPDTVPRST